jgi:hypothetical protein
MKVIRQASYLDTGSRLDPVDLDAVDGLNEPLQETDLRFIQERVGEAASHAFRLIKEDGPGYLVWVINEPPNRPGHEIVDIDVEWYWLGFRPEAGHFAERLGPVLAPWLESYDPTESFIAVLVGDRLYRAYEIAPILSKPTQPPSITGSMN